MSGENVTRMHVCAYNIEDLDQQLSVPYLITVHARD